MIVDIITFLFAYFALIGGLILFVSLCERGHGVIGTVIVILTLIAAIA